MNQNLTPNTGHEKAQSQEVQFHNTGAVFHIGNPDVSYDVLADDPATGDQHRFLVWMMTEGDENLGEVAGWQSGDPDTDLLVGRYDGFDYLNIPAGTRAARSILGGVQAWKNEKEEVLDFLEKYQKRIGEKENNGVDVSVTLDSVARIGDDHKFFVTPPHNVTNDPDLIKQWQERFDEDLKAVLTGDEERDALLHRYQEFVRNIPNKTGIEG